MRIDGSDRRSYAILIDTESGFVERIIIQENEIPVADPPALKFLGLDGAEGRGVFAGRAVLTGSDVPAGCAVFVRMDVAMGVVVPFKAWRAKACAVIVAARSG